MTSTNPIRTNRSPIERPSIDHTRINMVLLRGQVRAGPHERALPSGSQVVQFDLITEVDGSPATAPVSVTDPTSSMRGVLVEGAEVVVLGQVNRRFFRVGGRTQSRTEVVARRIVTARRRSAVARLLAEAASALDR